MNKDEFFKRKIFHKESIVKIKKENELSSKKIDDWYKSIEYEQIQRIKNKLESKLKQFAKNENIQIDITPQYLISIYLWFTNEEKKCYYCNLSEDDLDSLNNQYGHINKRYPKRGKVLEIDRKISSVSYLNINNLVLSCYWCNNAKTDTISVWTNEMESLFKGNHIVGLKNILKNNNLPVSGTKKILVKRIINAKIIYATTSLL